MATLTLDKSAVLAKRPALAKLLDPAQSKIAKAPKTEVSSAFVAPSPPAPPAPPQMSQNEISEAPRPPKPRYHHHDPLDEATRLLNQQRHDAWAAKLDAAERVLRERCAPFRDPSDPKPLALGTREAVVALLGAEIPVHELVSALARWCHRSCYAEALARGGPRYALDGTPDGDCAETHRRDRQ